MHITTKSILALLCTLPQLVSAQLPANYQLENDWLIHPQSFKAKVSEDKENKRISFSNGLISRTIDLRLGTTIAFRNLMTGETIIRAVEPEGSISINGKNFFIGGAEGQKNKAFLTEEWIKNLRPKKNALQLVDFHIGEPKERLKWKRTRHHAPDAVWPPKGKYLRLDYQFPTGAGSATPQAQLDSSTSRKLIFDDPFTKLDTSKQGWKIHATKAHPRANFENEGKPGEIYTLPNTAVYAERALPSGTKLVEAEINVGTDNSSSWGPGIGLVFKNGKVIKFNIYAGKKRPVLACYDGSREIPNVSGKAKIKTAQPVTLRARLENGVIYFDAKQSGKTWKQYRKIQIPSSFGNPVAFRVGKMAKDGGSADENNKGKLVRLRVNQVRFFSEFDNASLAKGNASTPYKNLTVSVHYEIYDGLPAFSKWITVSNGSKQSMNLDRFNAETLSVVEYESQVMIREGVPIRRPRVLHVETDMAFGGFTYRNANRHTVHWLTDPQYRSQVNWPKATPCLLKVEPTFGPDQTIAPGKTFESFHVFELVHDSEDRDRRGLALKRMYRTVAPWVTENPLMLHCVSSDEKVVHNAIDQAHTTGFEVVILSFGSGFKSENDNPKYLAKWKKINDYALSKGIHLGSYSLYSSRSAGKANNIIPPKGMKNAHGRCPAITSSWGQTYIKKLYNLFEKTGFMVFENDGAYPGDVDITPRPPLQKGVNDSRWVHWRIWTDFYKFLRARGVYFNLPDYYYLSGSSKCGMGYREVNWSLPRAQQRIITRQNIYDGTWEKTPSMGWMFVPLTKYHGGGAAATIEPLQEHLDHYRTMMQSNLGMGVQAFYRGPRLYDTDKTKKMVTDTVSWYKKHRTILESDMIHGKRADGKTVDWMLHVNPSEKEKERAFLSAYNPTDKPITTTINASLYYAGLTGSAKCSVNGGESKLIKLDSNQRAKITLTIPAQGYAYVIFYKNN